MAARLTRAKKKIAAARIPYVVPAADELPARLDAVLAVIHLLYTIGHTAPSGERPRARRSRRARARPRADAPRAAARSAEVARAARAAARQPRAARDPHRCRRTPVAPRGPGPRAWDRAAIAEGDQLVVAALDAGPPGRFTLQAAIAALHAEGRAYDQTDWRADPRPVRRAAAGLAVAGRRAEPRHRARDGGGARGRARRGRASRGRPRLARYHYLPATKADLLVRLGRRAEAAAAYRAALELADNDAERAFLAARLAECAGAAQLASGACPRSSPRRTAAAPGRRSSACTGSPTPGARGSSCCRRSSASTTCWRRRSPATPAARRSRARSATACSPTRSSARWTRPASRPRTSSATRSAASSRCSSPRAAARATVVALAPAGGWARRRRGVQRDARLLRDDAGPGRRPPRRTPRRSWPRPRAGAAATRCIADELRAHPGRAARPPDARRSRRCDGGGAD